MTPQTIHVTADDIAKATRGWTGRTPVELAVKTANPGDWPRVDVYGNWMHLCGAEEGCQDADLPWEVQDFLPAWWAGKDVTPIRFTVNWKPAEDEEQS